MRCRTAALLVCGVLLAQGAAAQDPAGRYLVIPFANDTGDPRGFWLSEGAAVALTDDLREMGLSAITRDDRLRAFDRLRVPAAASLSHATVIRIGELLGATQVVVGSFALEGDELTVRARTIELETGRLSGEIVESGNLADIFGVFGRAARRIAPPSSLPPERVEASHPPPAAFEQYIKGVLAESPAAQVTFITQALRTYPEFERARVALWRIHTEAGEHLSALAVIRQVPIGHRLSRQADFLEAVSLLHLGQHAASLALFAELNARSADAALLNNMGIVQLRRGDAPAGDPPTRYFHEAVKVDPADSDLFFNLGYAYWRAGDRPNAIQWLREAVRRNPADHAAHYVLGVALEAAGSTVEAAREKELARQLSSVYAEWERAQAGAGTVPDGLERLKIDIDLPAGLRLEEAIVAAEQRDQREVAQFHLDAGRRLFEAERDEEAIAELRRVIFLTPYEADAHLLLARIYLRTGRTDDAIDALKIAVWSDPANAAAQMLLDTLQ